MPNHTLVEVYAFDISVEEIRSRGPKDEALGAHVSAALQARLPLGATNLEAVVRHISREEKADGADVQPIVLLITDAIPMDIEHGTSELEAVLRESTAQVVLVAVIGPKHDKTVCNAIAAAGHGRVVHIPLERNDSHLVA